MVVDQTDEVTAAPADPLETARSLLASWAWAEALDAARSAVVPSDRAEADRLDIVAETSWWLGQMDDCIDAREQAYALYDAQGDGLCAGRCAVWLWEHHQLKARPSIAGGWLRRARRALEADTESVEFGDLMLREAEVAHGSGELDRATALARDALALGRRLSSIDLEAAALQTIGRLLIDAGNLTDGLGHLDEAMLSAVEGKLNPYTTGKVYCSLISACEQLGDLSRAAEWTDATLRWSEDHPMAMWPGICRVHHAALLQLRGDWGAAEREARQACMELDGFHVPNVAAGYIEIGDIRRRLGDLDGAEAAFATAEELCGQQSAGLALVRLAQRRVDAATAIITQMLEDHTWNRLARAKLLPAACRSQWPQRTSTPRLRPPTSSNASSPSTTAQHCWPQPCPHAAGSSWPRATTAPRARRCGRRSGTGNSSRSPTRSPPSACCSARHAEPAATKTQPPARSPAQQPSSTASGPPSIPATSGISRPPRRCRRTSRHERRRSSASSPRE